MNTKLNKIKKILKENNIKGTHQRIRIMEYLMEQDKHPTVEEIYQEMVKEIPTLSKTTVYNSIEKFVEKGLVEELTITGRENHYSVENKEHCHFFCRKCKNIYDIMIDQNKKRGNNNFLTEEGHKIEESHRYFKGICQNCLEKDL